MSQQFAHMATPPGSRPKNRKQQKKVDPVVLGLMIAFVLLAIAAGVVGFIFVRNLVISWTSTDLPGVPVATGGENLPAFGEVPEGEEYTIPLQDPGDLEPEPWDGASRVNMLVMGLDYRDWEAGDIPRTDSMILVTMDPITHSAGMLSIPRDMWVNIPGFGHGKINTAYFLGEANKLPGGGPALAVAAVEEFLGVPIHFYAQIDFQAFVDFIDLTGGVDIHVKEELTIDPIGPGNTIFLKPGVQTFDGATTLAYARARYTEGSDFDRAARQQQVIMAILDNILNYYSLPKLVQKSPELYQTLSAGIRTNLNLQQAIKLAWSVAEIPNPEENIQRAVITPDMVTFDTSPDGLFIMKPIPDEIRILRDSIFADGGPLSPIASTLNGANSGELVREENARISVQNGTESGGLASLTSQYFGSQGMTIVEETNAPEFHSYSELIIYNGKPYTIQYLSELMGIPPSRIYNQYNPDSYADVVVILGQDWAENNPLQ